MAIITGKDGKVSLSTVHGTVAGGIDINAWTMNITREVINASAFEDTDTRWVTNHGGQISATATISGMVTADGAAWDADTAVGTEGKIQLYSDAADFYEFTAIVTGSSVSINRGGDATITITVGSTGVIEKTDA